MFSIWFEQQRECKIQFTARRSVEYKMVQSGKQTRFRQSALGL